VSSDLGLFDDSEALQDESNESELFNERRLREWSDGARYIHWSGIVLLGVFVVALLNAIPPRWSEPAWQLNLISLLLANGVNALLGALLICLALLFNPSDSQVKQRTLLVRTLASWVALGWILLIPLQLFLGVRIINSQAANELGQIQSLERTGRAVANANTEAELRAVMAQIPNQPPLPRLTVPWEVAKANLLTQFQRNISASKTRQQQTNSTRWQTWLKEVTRNSLMSVLLGLGFLAIGKNRQLPASGNSKSSRRRSRR
jgi:hypothetical protein